MPGARRSEHLYIPNASVNPFAAHRRLIFIAGSATVVWQFQGRPAVLAGQQPERSECVHIEPTVGRYSQTRLKCAHRKFQIGAIDSVAFTFVKPASTQQDLRTENDLAL